MSDYKKKNVSLSIERSSGLPAVLVDSDMLTQALDNLLDNALRYARNRVQVRLKRAGPEIIIEVVDDGRGLPAGNSADLFDKFVQLERPKGGDGYKGTGLGLAICREIMGLNGGRIWAGNVKGWGAGFSLAVPVAAAAEATAARRHAEANK